MTGYEVIDCAEHNAAPFGFRWGVYLNGVRAKHLGKKGFFPSKIEAEQAVTNATKYGTQNV